VIILIKQENIPRESEAQDAHGLAEFIKKQRNRDSLLDNFVGVALSSYMNGINDATRSYKAATQPSV